MAFECLFNYPTSGTDASTHGFPILVVGAVPAESEDFKNLPSSITSGNPVVLESELSDAVGTGNLEAIRCLLDAGADVRYIRPKGYTVMIDVMHGRSIADDEQLIPVLRLLIDRGANLDAVSEYGESALSVASNLGRFDAVGLLLDSRADPAPLMWSPLMRAVALGSIEDVRSRIAEGQDLAARDRWDRTAWLLSVQTGEVAKAEMLLHAGTEKADRGRCGKTPLMYAIANGHATMLRWLLAQGMDPNETDEFGATALIEAAGRGATDCIRMLLDAGADVHYSRDSDSAIQSASNLEVVRILVEAGADLNDINGDVRAALTRLPHDGSIACSLEEYRAAKNRIFGTANPERMNYPFWKAMVSGGANAYHARVHFEQVRLGGEAVWCFDRFGTSINELPDGRIIEIGGEHEDYYDEDFCIYNDVIVHHGDGSVEIYGYPANVFPPTDFHTATLVGNSIYIIGNLGYRGQRRFGTTPVHRLDIDTLAIEPLETSGDSPGWINRHKAKLVDNRIEVAGGMVCGFGGGEEFYEENLNLYILDLAIGVWSRVK
jgi:ankyrin repeat protein